MLESLCWSDVWSDCTARIGLYIRTAKSRRLVEKSRNSDGTPLWLVRSVDWARWETKWREEEVAGSGTKAAYERESRISSRRPGRRASLGRAVNLFANLFFLLMFFRSRSLAKFRVSSSSSSPSAYFFLSFPARSALARSRHARSWKKSPPTVNKYKSRGKSSRSSRCLAVRGSAVKNLEARLARTCWILPHSLSTIRRQFHRAFEKLICIRTLPLGNTQQKKLLSFSFSKSYRRASKYKASFFSAYSEITILLMEFFNLRLECVYRTYFIYLFSK